MSFADMNDAGQDVRFLSSGQCFAVHRATGAVAKFVRNKNVSTSTPRYRLGFPTVTGRGVRPERGEADGELEPVESPVQVSLPLADDPRAGTVPRGRKWKSQLVSKRKSQSMYDF